MKLIYPATILSALLLFSAGCGGGSFASTSHRAASINTPSSLGSIPGKTHHTAHYAIHTTLNDDDLIERLSAVCEAAYQQYRLLTPGVLASPAALDCYVFANRRQWARFTAENTGEDAAVYLRINRGGYTIGDWYVAYFIGDTGTFAVAAHEGWHQYVARHFKSRLPPFLEEGIATTFENIRWTGSGPRFEMTTRSIRAQKLRDAIASNDLWPLDKLIVTHAGEVVGLGAGKIEAFYAQSWAFAKFLTDADAGIRRPALQALLTDCAAGTAYAGIDDSPNEWNPDTVRPLLERYLNQPLEKIDADYRRYVNELAAAAPRREP